MYPKDIVRVDDVIIAVGKGVETSKRAVERLNFKYWCEEQGIDCFASRTRQRFHKDFTALIDRKSLPIQIKRIQGYEYFEGFRFKEF